MTTTGARVRREVEGLEEYIRRAEKAEIELRDAPERTPELFSQLLPYAVALDVSDLWVRQFEGLLVTPPSWYAGSVRGFSSGRFHQSLAASAPPRRARSSPRRRARGAAAAAGRSEESGGGGGGSW
jgi:uncharacterized membrane protein